MNFVDVKFKITNEIAHKILSNKKNAIYYLQKLNYHLHTSELENIRENYKANYIWGLVEKYWDYSLCKSIIRNMFKETPKYKNGKEAEQTIKNLLQEWEKLNLGEISWPCSQGDFDGFVQRINSLTEDGTIKDEKIKIAAVKYRRLKELNTLRNDYIETLIFEKNEYIIPTLEHKKGVDFFINGISFDQKVAKSPTKQFMNDFAPDWKEYAIKNPQIVGQYLYKYQDEGRFGWEPRLFIVYLDEDIQPVDIQKIITNIDLINPYTINFDFVHKIIGHKTYQTKCFVILIYKQYH